MNYERIEAAAEAIQHGYARLPSAGRTGGMFVSDALTLAQVALAAADACESSDAEKLRAERDLALDDGQKVAQGESFFGGVLNPPDFGDDPLWPHMPVGDQQPFRDWRDFLDRVCVPLVDADDDAAEQAAMSLYRKANPHFIATCMILAARGAGSESAAIPPQLLRDVLNLGNDGALHEMFGHQSAYLNCNVPICTNERDVYKRLRALASLDVPTPAKDEQ